MTRAQAIAYRAKIVAAAAKLTDAEALESMELFDVWDGTKDYAAGERVRDNGQLYKCKSGVSANPTWRPSITLALWEAVTVGEDGTLENPITAATGMKYFKDKYYKEEGKVYLCIRDDNNGEGTILYYTPSQLVGTYFTEVTE